MKYSLVILSILLFATIGSTQDSSVVKNDSIKVKWSKQLSFNLGKNHNWSADVLGNIYIEKNDVIRKYDSTGMLKYEQSVKALGDMTQLVPVNTMKLVHFSEEQQTLCYLDNTLTISEECINLLDEGINNASVVTSSIRPDKMWIFDNLNSTLLLLDVEGTKDETVRIINLLGLLGANDIDKMKENNQLYILDKSKGIYILDMYGNLANSMLLDGIIDFDVEDNIYLLRNNQLEIYSLNGDLILILDLPINEVTKLRVVNNQIFLGTAKIVDKYLLEI